MDSKKIPDKLILEALERIGECNFNTLRKETGLSYYTLVKAIERLILRGLVVEKRIGRLRVIKLIERP